ncbi:hypothetical protein BRADI_1g03146v3, partial [Brachypodium distachyon]
IKIGRSGARESTTTTAVLPGCSFSPTEIELTDVYLRRKIAGGHDFPVEAAGFFHDADVYSDEPEKLVQPFLPRQAPAQGTSRRRPGTSSAPRATPAWYFFSPARYAGKKKSSGRRSRTIDGDGSKNWHSEKMAQPVEGGSAVGGCVQKLSYMVKNEASGKSERAGWIMAEYGISPEHGGGHLVLCKILMAADEVIYGFSSVDPGFSPEMLERLLSE